MHTDIFTPSAAAVIIRDGSDYYMVSTCSDVDCRDAWTWLQSHRWFGDVNDHDLKLLDAFMTPIRALQLSQFDIIDVDAELPGWRALFPQWIVRESATVRLW
jgi:hypothetical protein